MFLLLAVLAIPAQAQEVTIFHTAGGTSFNNPITGLIAFPLGDVETRDLVIEARDWPATVSFGVGSGSRCAYGDGDATRLVGFHNASGRYTGGQPIAEACTYRGQPKCSRTVTVRGRSYTANRGHPSCGSNMQQGDNNVPMGTPTASTGMFTVRIWGKVCLNGTVGGVSRCSQLGPERDLESAGQWLSHINQNGYRATFAPRRNCGPAKWPTTEMRSRGRPSYAEWCDFTVMAR